MSIFFKLYNDQYGHVAGDVCLKEVGAALSRSICRPGDMAARYGGEEFIVILPETSHSGAMCVAETILQEVSDAGIGHRASPISPVVSVSIGAATWIGQEDAGVRAEGCRTLVEEADGQLYLAKQAGRARVVGIELHPKG